MNKSENLSTKNSKVKTLLKKILKNWRIIALFLAIYDMLALNGSHFLALWLRFDCSFSSIPTEYLTIWAKFAPIYTVVGIAVLWKLKLYKSIWKFASFIELERITLGNVFLLIFHVITVSLVFGRMPVTYYVVGIIIQSLLTVFIRFSYRFVLLERSKKTITIHPKFFHRIMLIGAGTAGQMLLRDLHSDDESDQRVCCIIDDDENKWGRFIDGVPIVGGRDDILLNADKYKIDKIFLAIPSSSVEQRRDILNICKETSCILKSIPSAFRTATNTITAKSVVDVKVEDLLGRDSVKVDMDEIYGFLSGKTILVTGGGGSIGSELCRQIAKHTPQKLIIFDIYENNAHAIGLELRDEYPDLNLEVLIGSVRDSRRLEQVFSKYKPDVVYHAAAHKHVPLMEDSPCEAIKNNAIGTYKTAYAAMTHGVKRFVLISTDKAVNPTNIMGASKRLCEMIIQAFDSKIRKNEADDLISLQIHADTEEMKSKHNLSFIPKTEFVAVRFGNVLGSNGSVVPRFKEQIAKGGPVTVTHPEIIRYFMTIPEAASLVLQAGTYANGGEIFVLDMGEPVKIDTLARNLIRLSGLTPDVDIKIEYTGLRSGEKLYEEKLLSEEGLKKTANNLIHIGQPIPFNVDNFLGQLVELMNFAYDGEKSKVLDLVMKIVRTYHPAENSNISASDDTKKIEVTL